VKIKKYQPTSGSEGEGFGGNWCFRCERDRNFRGTGEGGCAILAATMMLDVKDDDDPRAWRYDENGKPVCTEFTQDKQPGPTVSDKKKLEAAGQLRLF
jgi:hypothetical protein